MNHIDRRKFLEQSGKAATGAVIAAAVPSALLMASGKAFGKPIPGKPTYEVIEGYSMDPDLIHKPRNPDKLTEFEKLHVPTLKMPIIAEDGSVVPFYVVSDHPMEKDHYIESVEIVNFGDPIVHKGMIHFTQTNGVVYFSSQIRAVSGTNTIRAIMKCNKHSRWVGEATVKVTVGGC